MNSVRIAMPLNNGHIAYVSPEDAARLSFRKWDANADKNTFYAQATSEPRQLLHRAILGLTDPEIKVDHIDGDGLNNTRENLRVATPSQNAQNQRKQKGTTSKYKGVTWNKRSQKWVAQIGINKRRQHLGYFTIETDAAHAYNLAALELFGEFARLNVLE